MMASSPNREESHKERIRHLCAAVQSGNLSEIETILHQGMYLNADEGGNMIAKSLYRNLLMLAIESLQVDTAKFLIQSGIDVNHKTWGVNGKQGAREMALENGLTEIVDLIDSKLPVPKRLFYAVVDGEREKAETLLQHIDADMNMKVDLHGDKAAGCSAYTLLMVALKNGQVDIATSLIDHGIDIDFEHQEWDRPDATSEPIEVESFDARTLAMDMGMVGVAIAIEKRKGGVANGDLTPLEHNGHTTHLPEQLTSKDETTTNATPTKYSTSQINKQDQRRVTGCTCTLI